MASVSSLIARKSLTGRLIPTTTARAIWCAAILLVTITNGCNSIKFEGENFGKNKEHILEASYHGLIKENETFVELTPIIKVDETQVCDFRIIKKSNHEIPFEIELVNNLAVLKATKTLNCEKHIIYRFDILAILCDGSHSNSANVHVAVSDINEYSPVFSQPSYVIDVDEGRLYKEIIRVEATDRDCSPLFGDICKYEILTGDSADHLPFSIDKEGVIRNNVPLSHKVAQNHILSVVAYDCAMKQSAPVMVNIHVRRVCEARINGVPEHVNYTTSTSIGVDLFPKISFELCHLQCSDTNMFIQSTVNLKTNHISFGCDRDADKCFQQNNVVDLLPKFSQWTKDLTYDEGGSDAVFHFDGNSGAIVPSNTISHHDFAMRPFSISTIFRHHSIATNDKHTKEHVICSADDHKMNRHHMALFVRNCRLILLLRKNFNEGDLNIFSPAEWRWKIPEVCDNEWHHYTVNVDIPKVELYIDGRKFDAIVEDRHSNPEVIDDWPLHAAHGVNTTLAIGACYQGSENRLKHGFNGDIAEIKVALQSTLSDDEIRCTNECAEHLVVPSEHLLEPAQQIQSNAQLNEIIIEGSNQTNIEKLLQNIQYLNSKEIPSIGRRNIEIKTVVSCPGKKAIRLPTVETYLMVMKDGTVEEPSTLSPSDIQLNGIPDSDKALTSDEKPQILITGKQNHLVSYQDIKEGVHILANVNINVMSGDQLLSQLQKLDSCIVTVFPSLNPDHEQIAMPKMENLSSTLDIKTAITKDGVEMIGFDSIVNYQSVLQSLVYTNKKPAYYLNRVFKLSCSQMNARFRSAEYTMTITVLHPKQMPTNAPKEPTNKQEMAASEQSAHDPYVFAHAMVHNHGVEEPVSKIHDINAKNHSSMQATLLIAVIGIAFVVLVCGIIIARIRSGSDGALSDTIRKFDKHIPAKLSTEPQLDWDDSALTITINPMQNCSLSDESSESENSDSEDEEITTNGRYRNVSQLEWDNSTI